MARQNHGPLSRAKGKLGGVVYQQYEGMQISREYQPVVKNPQTTKQTENRAKFKLSSQIVAQFKDVLNVRLSSLSIYTRIRRASSVNAIYNVIDVTTPESPAILVADVQNAINAKSVSAIAAPVVTTSSGEFSIVAEAGDTCFYTAASYNSDGKVVQIESDSFESDGTAKTVTPADRFATAVVMAVSVRATTEAGRATISNLNAEGNTLSVEISRSIAAGDIEVTNMRAVSLTA